MGSVLACNRIIALAEREVPCRDGSAGPRSVCRAMAETRRPAAEGGLGYLQPHGDRSRHVGRLSLVGSRHAAGRSRPRRAEDVAPSRADDISWPSLRSGPRHVLSAAPAAWRCGRACAVRASAPTVRAVLDGTLCRADSSQLFRARTLRRRRPGGALRLDRRMALDYSARM